MRHFYLRARIEERMGDWNAVDSLMQKALAAAEKVARYRHAQLSAVRLAGDIIGKMDDLSLDELLVTIKQEWAFRRAEAEMPRPSAKLSCRSRFGSQ